MTTSRQKILTYLKKTRFASAHEIGRALKLSAPNVRHHLSILCADGRVEAASVRGGAKRGRPEKLYSLSPAALGDNLPALTLALLAENPNPKVIGARMARSLGLVETASTGVMAKRLAALVEKLNELHYQARWEAGAQGPRLLFGRCPYARVIEGHPEICKMDEAMLGTALARPIEAARRNEPPSQGSCPLLFKIG
ncbi:MAG: hypothetical protein DPW18_08460 [Chloroflexi bacterium]|nr:hypothetical protein [Chloroflexota bacterium]MDL1941806.1 ArsR family transcriptional regulator [Chloroflexi bacterium CFX2]